MAFLNMIFLKIVGFLLSIILVWTVQAPAGVTIVPKDEENLLLQATVLADVHMQSFEYSGFQELSKTLLDIGASKVSQDALVFVGDNTMNGQNTEYLMFYGLLSRYSKVDPKNTFVAMGNHDFMVPSTPRAAIDRHSFFYQSYTGVQPNGDFHSKKINGCTFITLGSESEHDTTVPAWQVELLAEAMAAAEPGKPVFVFVHYLLYTAAALDVLRQHPNVFLFNGHWHSPLHVLESDDGITRVNLEGLHSHVSEEYAGEGVQLEVYANRVLLRGRNYMTGEWLEEFEVALK